MKETISSGKTVEAAVERGARELGLAVSEVQFEVIAEAKKGFLGLGETMAQVRVFPIGYKPEPVVEEKTNSKQAGAQVRKREAQSSLSHTPAEASRPSAGNAAGAKEKPTPKAEAKPAKPAKSESNSAGTTPGVEFIQTLIANMGINVAVDANIDGSDVNIEISGADAGVLIGYHGETLTAVQYLANLAANKREEDEDRPYSRVTVDIEGYRAKREATLVELANRTAAKVKRTGRYVYLDAMPAHERRIIHATIQEIDGVSTYSKGEESRRCVVVCLERK